jgi:hypothetical protein
MKRDLQVLDFELAGSMVAYTKRNFTLQVVWGKH